MKKIYYISLLLVFNFVAVSFLTAQKKPATGYEFKDIKRLPTTSVKNQYRSGTCWSFSALSFLESEMLRKGKKDPDLSEMFVVRNCYSDKAKRTVRMHGHLNFGGGGAFHDALYVLKKYGAVPEEAYKGLTIGEEKHIHGEMDQVLKDYVDGVVKNKNRKLTPVWHQGFEGLLDVYLGKYPEKFKYKGKEYTPKSFAKEVVGLNPDDYVEITSFSHHPFYSKFILEVPDNWLWGEAYNVPLNDFKKIISNAIDNGYTVAWASDVSENGFSYSNGIAVVPNNTKEDLADTERSKWDQLSRNKKNELLYNLKAPGKEKTITQEMRQKEFDNFLTTDDHGMHIIGKAKDQNGTLYYIVKNSWDTDNLYDGYFYASEAFVVFKATNIMVHKDAIPKEIRKKLKL